MLRQYEEREIHKGIDEVMFHLRHLPVDDVAYFLVRFNPKLADNLAVSIQQQIFDINEGNKYE
jgi:hypothetical protein